MTHYLTYFETAVKTFWNNLALSNYGKEDFTFGQVAEQIERNHILLELAGAQRGDKVVLCARNSAQWAMAFMSVTSFDAVVVPVLNDFPPESVQKLTAHSDATVIFTEPGIWEKMDAEAMPNLKAAFNMLSGKALMLRDSELTAEAIKAKVEEEFKKRFPNGMKPENVSYPTGSLDELEIINYTSGKTSAPKGFMLSALNFISNIEFGRNRIPAYEGETMLSMLPMAHLYGMAFEFV
ncbi:MAG: AMP-binding protein, partial [Bacteroidaceae bacterium]|nr:AMP-binding protein [Bacteroidaceae bacterium]